MVLKKEVTNWWLHTRQFGYTKENLVVVYFVEFYEWHHKFMKIIFGFGDSDKYVVEEVNEGRLTNTAEVMLNCEVHPANIAPKLTDCQHDYGIGEDDGLRIDTLFSQSQTSQKLGWVWQLSLAFGALIDCLG